MHSLDADHEDAKPSQLVIVHKESLLKFASADAGYSMRALVKIRRVYPKYTLYRSVVIVQVLLVSSL